MKKRLNEYVVIACFVKRELLDWRNILDRAMRAVRVEPKGFHWRESVCSTFYWRTDLFFAVGASQNMAPGTTSRH